MTSNMKNEFGKAEDILSEELKPMQGVDSQFKSKLDTKMQKDIATLKQMQGSESEQIEKFSFWKKFKMAFWSTPKRKRYALSGSFLFMLPIMLVIIYTVYPQNQVSRGVFQRGEYTVELSPTILSASGVAQDSSFLLVTGEDMNILKLKETIVVSPKFEFDLRKVEEGYEISPRSKLQKDVLYEVKILDQGEIKDHWNFRVEPAFAIINSSPEYDAPVNSVIEVNFNYSDINLKSFKNAFRIYPEIDIKDFKQEGKTIKIIPSNKFEQDTEYQLIVEASVKRDNGEFLKSPYKAYIRTVGKTDNYKSNIYFPSSDGSFVEVIGPESKTPLYMSDYKENTSGKFIVYKVKHSKLLEASTEIYAYSSWSTPAKVNKDYSDQVLMKEFTASSEVVLDLPKTVPGELLYVEAIYAGQREGRYYSNTKISSHITTMQNEIVLAVFDGSGKLVKEGIVSVIYRDSNNQVQTKKFPINDVTRIYKADIGYVDGIMGAVVQTADDSQILINDFSYDYDDHGFSFNEEADATYDKDVLTYYMFDKPIYKNGDNVEFKAVMKSSKDFTTFDPYDVSGLEYIVLMDGSIAHKSKPEIINQKDGYITGRFSIPEVSAGDYSLGGATVRIVKGSDVISEGSIDIREYLKPKYTLNVNVIEESTYVAGEEVEFRITGNDLAGNPLSNTQVETIFGYSGTSRGSWYEEKLDPYLYNAIEKVVDKKNITLDESGQAVLKYTIPDANLDTNSDFYTIILVINLDKQTTLTKSVLATKGDTTILAKSVSEKSWGPKGAEFPVLVKTVDTKSLQPKKIKISEVKIYRQWYEKIVSQQYNYETNTNEDYYDYKEHVELFSTRVDLETGDNGELNLVNKYDLSGTYIYQFKFLDSLGKTVTYKDEGLVSVYDNDENSTLSDVSSAVEIETNKEVYKVGDKVKVRVDFADDLVNKSDAYMLFFKDRIYQQVRIEIKEKSYTFEYEVGKELSPNAAIKVITNRHISEVDKESKLDHRFIFTSTKPIIVRRDEDLLNVKIDTDKKVYAPGEKVQLTISVTDENNRTVGDANLNIRVFDKALLQALGKTDLEKDIYEMIFGSYRRKNSGMSFPLAPYGGGRGDGGDGPSGIRSNFKEVATFQTELVTDNTGKAKVEFALPDSITTWVIDTDAITDHLNIGNNNVEVVTNKDRIIDVNLPSIVKEGDIVSPQINIYNYGKETLKGTVVVETSDNLSVAKYEQKVEIGSQRTAKKEVLITVGKSASANRVTVKLLDEKGKLVDGVEKTVKVNSGGFPSNKIMQSELVKGVNDISFKISDPKQSQATLLLTPDKYRQSFYPRDYFVDSTDEKTAALIQNIALYKNYDKSSEYLGLSKESLKQQIGLTLGSLSDGQNNENLGYGAFSYNSPSLGTSVNVAYALGRAKAVGITDQVNNTSGLANYLSKQVVNSDGNVNKKTTPADKVLATNGLSYLGDDRALNYALVLKAELNGSESNAEIAILADSLYAAGSTSDAKILASSLVSKLIEEGDMNSLPPEKQPYSENDQLSTFLLWELISKMNIYPEQQEKIGNWISLNGSQAVNSNEEAMLAATIMEYSKPVKVENLDIEVSLNGKNIYKGATSNNGNTFVLDGLQTGENKVQIITNSAGMSSRLLISDVTQEQVTNTSEFTVKTEYLPLENQSATTTLPKGEYIILRVTVTNPKKHKGFNLKTYLPSGLTKSIAVPSSSYSNEYSNWLSSSSNVNKWPATNGKQLLFKGYYDKDDTTQVFETLLISDYKGKYKTNGTFVYIDGKSDFAGYEASKEVVVQ